MIIQSLQTYWPTRKMEWLMAGMLTAWGCYVLTHPEMFSDLSTRDTYAGMKAVSDPLGFYPSVFWGGAAFIVGFSRAVALFVNGAWTRTPLVRVIASLLSMMIFTQIVVGFWSSGLPNPGLVVYPWFIVADLLSAYRAAVDIVHAEKQREVDKETRRDGRRHHSFAA